MPTLPRLLTFVSTKSMKVMKTNLFVNWLQRVYGAGLGVIGLNHLLHFWATPAYEGKAASVYAALVQTGYMLPAVGLCMLLTSAALLVNRRVTAGLLLMTPVWVNMLLFHLFLAPGGIAPALILSGIGLYLLFHQLYRPLDRPVVRQTSAPTGATPKSVRVMLTATAVASLVIPAIADLNATHLTNPLWPAHARFHFAIQFFSNLVLNGIALWLLWGRHADRGSRLAVVVAALGPLLFWGMFVPALLMPGVSTWPDGVAPPPGFPALLRSIHPNLILAVIVSVTNLTALHIDSGSRVNR